MPTAAAKASRRPRTQAIAPIPVETFVAAPFARPLDQWLVFPTALFKASEPLLTGWIERRCAGAAALLDSAAGLARCDDLGAAAAVHAAWLEGAMSRLEADVRAASDQATAIAQCFASLTGPSETAASEPVYQGPDRRSPSRPWSKTPTPIEPAPSEPRPAS